MTMDSPWEARHYNTQYQHNSKWAAECDDQLRGNKREILTNKNQIRGG
jgi:hypothetical protein